MEDDCEDAQYNTDSDESLRSSTKRRRVTTPPLFDSPELSHYESNSCRSSDGVVFPSELESSFSEDVPIYPSEEDSLSEESEGFTPEAAGVSESKLSSDPCVKAHPPNTDEELEQVANTLVSTCCMKECLFHLTAHDVLTARRKFCSLERSKQRQWLADRVHENSCEEEKGKINVTYTIAGRYVCQIAWCKVYMVSQRRVSRILNSVLQGKMIIQHGNKGKQRMNTKSEGARTWMQRYFHLVGDKMPHNKQIHLPSWETQKDVHTRYMEDMKRQQLPDSDILSLSMFYKIWKDEFSNVVIPEQNRFAKCDICVKIKMERKGCLDKQKQTEMRAMLQEHLARVETERKKYHHHREKSRSNPSKCVTMIIDGMDQAKTNLPNTKIISKSTSSLWRLRTHVTGVLLHTKAPYGKLAFGYIDLLQWPHDSNLTLTLLFNTLLDFQRGHSLPPTLYLQMDNTSRENKNKFVLGFCAIIVELRIFEKVQINFLPVGHTHEDIDQLFSKIGEEIRRAGCESLPDLLQLVHRSSTPNPNSKMVSVVWDFKKWMEPFLGAVEGHSKYLAFRFTLNLSGRAEMHYKRFSSLSWEPKKSGIHILAGCPDATDVPPLVVPSSAKIDLEHFARDLQKYKPWLSSEAWQNWEAFMSNSKELSELSSDYYQWELPVLVSAAITASHARKQQVREPLSDDTAKLMAKETAVPTKVSVRHKGETEKNATTNSKKSTSSSVQGSSRRQGAKQSGIVPEPTTSMPLTNEERFVPNHQTLEMGMTVACFLPCYADEEPQIGKVVSIETNKCTVEWMTGTYSEPWVVCKRSAGRACTTWREEIPFDAVLFPVELTSSCRITCALKKLLIEAYELKRAECS